jgi:adenylosuccinate lyase
VGDRPAIDVAAIDAIEAVTRHDVIAFLTWVAEQVGDEARFMHQGMTSSDVLDTTLAVQLARAADILIEDSTLLARCASAPRSTSTPRRSAAATASMPSRSPSAQARAGLCRVRPLPRRLEAARAEIATCAISGAVGTFANIDPESRSMSPRGSGWRSSRSRPRSSRATATRCSSPRSA